MYLQRATNIFSSTLFYFVFVFVFFVSTHVIHAAELSLVSSAGNVTVGDNVKIRIIMSSPDQPANAVSGIVTFPKDLLTLNSISKSDSIVNVWPVEPSYSNANGTANLDGVILSGYKGKNGIILTLFFRAKATGTANVKFTTASILAHDGAGTLILNATNQATFDINDADVKPTPAPAVPKQVVGKVEVGTPSIEIEELKKKDEFDPHSRFFITSVGKRPKAPYNIEIDNTPYVWEDSGNHIFETVPLSRGIHSMKVFFESIDSDIISGSISFNTNSILAPVFTEYSNNVKENDFIVVKGKVDPLNYVIINSDALLSNGNTSFRESVTVRSDEKGVFTYVSENRASRGIYTITGQARTTNGVESSITSAIKISVQADTKSLFGKITDMYSLMIPAIALFALLIIIIIYGWHRILHYRERMKRRLLETRALVNKSFSILEEDAEEEAKILKKNKSLKPLTEEERNFVNQFKKDITSAERTILDDIKNSDKEI
jgi:hypothetical protein